MVGNSIKCRRRRQCTMFHLQRSYLMDVQNVPYQVECDVHRDGGQESVENDEQQGEYPQEAQVQDK